jgi:hypothetical protein
MTNKDREAFEAWWIEKSLHMLMDKWQNDAAWEAWKAARAHYAPKLTWDEAVQIAERAAYAAIYEPPMRKGFDDAHAAIRLQVNSMVRAALRAAGVKFRDEA